MGNALRTRRIPRPVAFWVVAAAFVVMMCGAAAPSPLYSVYQQQWGFSAITLTTIFAVYVVALLSALLTVGALSDHIGRRPVLVTALLVLAASMVVFIAAQGVPWLIVARVLQGLATGAATGAFTATIVDLQRHENRGALINSLAPTTGLAVGALGSGLLVQFAPAPTTLIYVLLAFGYLVSAAIVVAIPDPSPAPGFATRAALFAALRPSVAVPGSVRSRFLSVVPCLLATWSLGGLYLSLSPSITATVFGLHNHVIGGAEIATLFGFGALGAALTRTATPASVMLGGCLVLAGGVAVTVGSLWTASVAVFFLGAALSGFGFGAAFQGAMKTLGASTRPHERGRVFASVFTVSYTAFSVPALAAGFAVDAVGLLRTAEVYAGTVVVLALVAAAAAFAVTVSRPNRSVTEPVCPAQV